jgi:hypothetical protein
VDFITLPRLIYMNHVRVPLCPNIRQENGLNISVPINMFISNILESSEDHHCRPGVRCSSWPWPLVASTMLIIFFLKVNYAYNLTAYYSHNPNCTRTGNVQICLLLKFRFVS